MKTTTRTRILSVVMMLALLLTSLVIVVPVSAADKSDAAGSSVTTVTTKAPTVTAETLPTTHWCDEDESGNPLYADIEFAGTGTAEDPYQISSAAELAGLSWLLTRSTLDNYLAYGEERAEVKNKETGEVTQTAIAGKYYKLTADIDLGAHIWDPIGSWGVVIADLDETRTDYRFKGGFIGNNKTIKNLILSGTIAAAGEGLGLFRATGGAKEIANFDITAYVDVTMLVGPGDPNNQTIAAQAALGVISSYCTGFKAFRNINVYADYKLNNFVHQPRAGGLWGEAHNLIAYDCSFNGKVTIQAVNDPAGDAYQTAFGGAYSYNNSGYVDLYRVVNNADIVLHQGNANCIVGGIVASTGSKYDVYLEGCVNNGDISSYYTYPNSKGSVNIRIGGIIGNVGRHHSAKTSEDVQLRGCINTGKLYAQKTGTASAVYPIIGQKEDTSARPTVTMGEVFAAYELMGGSGDVTHMKRGGGPIRYLSEDTQPNKNDESDEAYDKANYTHNNNVLTPDSAVNFGAGVYKVEGDQAIIVVNQALKAFYLAGFSINLSYGSQTVTTIDPANFQANATYKIALPYEEGAAVSVTATKVSGDTTVTLVSGALTWRDVAATALTKGTGTEADPYQISTAEELAYLAVRGNTSETMSGQYYALTADIDLGGIEWLPIGLAYEQNNFNGVLDGQNHKIKNLTLTDRYYNWGAGFFGYFKSTFKNTVFENPVVNIAADAVIVGKSLNPAAIVAGDGYGGTITNVHVVGADYTADSDGSNWQGAFIGYLNGTKIYDSSISGTMNITVSEAAPTAMIGGFCARVKAGTLDGCSADMDINVTVLTNDLKENETGFDEETGEENVPSNRYVGVGGITGFNQADEYGNKGYINNCSSDSDINVTVDPTGTAYEYYVINAGGIVGYAGVTVHSNPQAYGYLEINNAVNSGDIVVEANGATANVAGIAGYATPNLADNYEFKITNAYSSTGATVLVTEEGGATSVTNGFVGAQFALDTLNKVDFRVDTANGLANSGLQFNSTIDKDVVAQIVAITTSAEALAAKEAIATEVANVEAAQAEIDMLNEELVLLEEELILFPEDAEKTQEIIDEIKADIAVAEEALKTAQAALAAAEKAYAPYNVTVEVGTAITLATTLAAAKGDADAIAAGKIMKIKSTDDLADNAFAAAIFNIKDNNRVYVAAGYVTVTIGGVSATVYGDFIYASASGIAQDIIDAGNATADQLAVLNQYVA